MYGWKDGVKANMNIILRSPCKVIVQPKYLWGVIRMQDANLCEIPQI